MTMDSRELAARPAIYYVRHGLTDWNVQQRLHVPAVHGLTNWNVQQRLQGRHDVPLNRDGLAQAVRCGEILHDLFVRDGRAPDSCDYVSSPLIRARETMELMRAALGLEPDRYRVDARLAEIAFGEWEGLTYEDVLARDPDVVAWRESDKWGFLPPGGESYADLLARVRAWHATLTRDSVVVAHGGTARALVALYGIAPLEAAATANVGQGVVYVFAAGGWTKYE